LQENQQSYCRGRKNPQNSKTGCGMWVTRLIFMAYNGALGVGTCFGQIDSTPERRLPPHPTVSETITLSDTEWLRLRSYLPTPKAQGRPRTHSSRDVLDTIFYVLKSGCNWGLLPHDFPPWSTVYYHFRRFRLTGLWPLILKAVRAVARKRVGQGSPTDGGHHGLPNSQDRRRIGSSKRL
jgi:transposase